MTAPVHSDDLVDVWRAMSMDERALWVHEAFEQADPGDVIVFFDMPVDGYADWQMVAAVYAY